MYKEGERENQREKQKQREKDFISAVSASRGTDHHHRRPKEGSRMKNVCRKCLVNGQRTQFSILLSVREKCMIAALLADHKQPEDSGKYCND